MRIAFFGGSFDPPHQGHLAVARAARTALALDRVLFAPVGQQPLKPAGSSATFDHRVAMTRLAIADEPAFALSLADAPSEAPNYTIDTLFHLRSELPAGSELFCILGADSLLGLPRWHRAAELPFAATLIVAARPGQSLAQLERLLPAGLTLAAPPAPVPAPENIVLARATLRNTQGRTASLYLLPNLAIDLSATALRQQAHNPHHPGLPEPVFDYIAAHNLYR